MPDTLSRNGVAWGCDVGRGGKSRVKRQKEGKIGDFRVFVFGICVDNEGFVGFVSISCPPRGRTVWKWVACGGVRDGVVVVICREVG